MMRYLGLLALLLTGFSVAAPVHAAEPEKMDDMIVRAVWAEDRLWLLDGDGRLTTLREGADKRVEESLPVPARGMCVREGAVVVATDSMDGAWTLRRHGPDGWKAIAAADVDGDALRTMACTDTTYVLAGTQRMATVTEDNTRVTELSAKPGKGWVSAAYANATLLYLATNMGEFGGTLQKIDLASGQMTEVTKTVPDRCAPGAADCSDQVPFGKVRDIAPLPWQPDCLVLAEGLVHFFPSGKLTRLCEKDAVIFYTRDYAEAVRDTLKGGETTGGDVAFYGLWARDGELWALGLDGLHRFRSDGTSDIVILPKTTRIDGLHVAFMTDWILIYSKAQTRAAAVNSPVPMLVPRGE